MAAWRIAAHQHIARRIASQRRWPIFILSFKKARYVKNRGAA